MFFKKGHTLFYLTGYHQEIWYRLFPQALLLSPKILFKLDHYIIYLQFEQTDPEKDVFIYFFAMKNAPVKGIISLKKSKVALFLIFYLSLQF